MILSVILAIVFLVISILHIYWALGGRWSYDIVLPTTSEGVKIIQPGFISCIVVAFVLLGFSLFYLQVGGLIVIPLTGWVKNVFGWIIPIIFLLRAIGDFKYIGFFKRVKDTTFGRMDILWYSPLCLLIGIFGLILNLGNY